MLGLPALGALMAWVGRRRETQAGWAEVARLASEAGHALGEDALRARLRRWRERAALPEGGNGTTP